ncbi:threonine synthase [Pyrococcus abyssi]|uniref:Threonine synthase n=1 Tax=Pyrococcus abyssi (strain GE5 / Orsay) TaxID=272844 RepID=Q9UZV8_PYRAB|nr:threonine synthase [Pyrococcus abyssi]CAB49948.1 thrC threonine synthase [Pyrococcus abyssi GE5]CCE70447.1 TPA: threonine synthase [Pyrococcus abyssi GE5]
MVLRCIRCGREYPEDEIRYRCECGGLLEVVVDLDKVDTKIFDGNNITLWKYESWLPVKKIVSLNEGGTPLYRLNNLEKILGVKELYAKNEGANPTGSFKDRGMTVGVSKALELGMKRVACASTGNTSASLAAYAAKAGIEAYVLVPSGKIALGKLAQAIIYGAKVIPIKGNFDDALRVVIEASEELGIYMLNSINPFRLEGQKTIAYEIYDQLQKVPDNVVLPVGNAGNISAIWKGFKELYEAGVIDKLPRMIGIQAEGASPLAKAWKEKRKFKPEKNPETLATAIRIGNPANWEKAWRAVEESGGMFEIVSDEEILKAQRILASKEGLFVEPASAASLAGLIKLLNEEKVDRDESFVLVTTGHGLKDPDIVLRNFKLPEPIEPTLDAFRRVIE